MGNLHPARAFPKPSPPPPPPPPVLMDELVEEVLSRLPPALIDELVEEVLLRLPPDEPAWFVRSSAVGKPWRRILAAPRFHRRYREFHGTPPLLGYFGLDAKFVPTSALLPAQPDRPGWNAFDCRHGRALLAPSGGYGKPCEFVVVDPLTGNQSRTVPSPLDGVHPHSASVLCAAQGCDHHACQQGHFLVALVYTSCLATVTYGWLYSSQTRIWRKFTPLHHPDVRYDIHYAVRSVLVCDALYFNVNNAIIKCQLDTLSISMLEMPTDRRGCLMAAEDGGLVFAAIVDPRNLTLWSMETGPEGALGWAITRVIDLQTVLPDGALAILAHEYWFSMTPPQRALVTGFAEGTQVIFVSTYVGCYMVDLKSGRVWTVSSSWGSMLPYMRFYFPAMEAAASTSDQEQ